MFKKTIFSLTLLVFAPVEGRSTATISSSSPFLSESARIDESRYRPLFGIIDRYESRQEQQPPESLGVPENETINLFGVEKRSLEQQTLPRQSSAEHPLLKTRGPSLQHPDEQSQ
mmetsp:Transcript_11445/g.18404  ORF Transcript_11445/g.18404 Transcript_11445/m.18404 type:complete len:115 (+) Transcript_11445:176-520(+)